MGLLASRIALAGMLTALGCGHATPVGAHAVGRAGQGHVVSETEVQQDVQRFTGELLARIGQAAEGVQQSASPAQREQLLRRQLLYQASALDIATGPVPAVNLLDMLVFVSLSRRVFEDYWIPKVFGEQASPLAEALRTSEADLWQTSNKLLDPAQQRELHALIDGWLRENPGVTRAEVVRLSEFSETAGEAARNKTVSGLMASVKSATRAADEAVLLGERALFFAQRAPFVARMQVRVGAQEVISDSLMRARALSPLLERTRSLEPMVQELSRLAENAQEATEEARRLSEEIQPLVSTLAPLLASRWSAEGDITALEHTLDTALRLTESSQRLLRELRSTTGPGAHDALKSAAREADRLLMHGVFYLALVGAMLVLLFWGGYYFVVERTRSANRRAP